MQNDLWTGLAERTPRDADMGDKCAFYEALKAIYGPSYQIQAPLRSSDGSTLLSDKEAILQRWSEQISPAPARPLPRLHRLQEGLRQGLACSFVGNHEEVQHQHKPYPSHQKPL